MKVIKKIAFYLLLAWSFLCALVLFIGLEQPSESPKTPFPEWLPTAPWLGAVDFVETPSGDVYVASSFVPKIIRYNQAGKAIALYQSPTSTPPYLTRLAVDDKNHLYIKSQDHVYVCSPDLEVLPRVNQANTELVWSTEPRERFQARDGSWLIRTTFGLKKYSVSGELLQTYGTPWYFGLLAFPFPACISGLLLLLLTVSVFAHRPSTRFLASNYADKQSTLFTGTVGKISQKHSLIFEEESSHCKNLLFIPSFQTRLSYIWALLLGFGIPLAMFIYIMGHIIGFIPQHFNKLSGHLWVDSILFANIFVPILLMVGWMFFMLLYVIAGCEKVTINTFTKRVSFIECFRFFQLELNIKRYSAPIYEVRVTLTEGIKKWEATLKSSRLKLSFGKTLVDFGKDYSDEAREQAWNVLRQVLPLQERIAQKATPFRAMMSPTALLLIGVLLYSVFIFSRMFFFLPQPIKLHTTTVSHQQKPLLQIPPKFVLKEHHETVYSVNFSFDGTQLISAGRDASVKIWKTSTGENLGSMTIGEEIEYVDFVFDTSIVVADNMYGTGTTFLDLNSRKKISPEKIGLHTLAANNTDVVTSKGELFAAVDYDNRTTVRIWNVIDGTEFSPISISENKVSVIDIALSSDGNRLAFGYTTPGGFMQGYNPPIIVVFDMTTGAIIKTLTGHEGDWIVDLTFSPDGQYLASAGEDKQVIVWDIANPANSVTFTGHRHDIKELAFSPDGRWVVSVSGNHWKPEVSKPGEIKFWDVQHATGPIALQSRYPAQSAAFSPDGRLLAIGSGHDDRGEILIWEVEDILRMM